MTTIQEIEALLWEFAPKTLAMDWDNVGLLLGDGTRPVQKILVALDVTESVCDEAIALGADCIVSHHPFLHPKWHPLRKISSETAYGRTLIRLLQHEIAVISMHTNLDATEGGVNDLLAEALGLEQIQPLNDEKIGRMGTLKAEIHLEQFLPSVLQSLHCSGLRYRDNGKPVYRVAVGGGACGSYCSQAIAQGCDTFVTADLGYHDFLDTTEINLIDAGHFPTENLVCGAIVQRIHARYPSIEVLSSASHRDAIQYYCKGE